MQGNPGRTRRLIPGRDLRRLPLSENWVTRLPAKGAELGAQSSECRTYVEADVGIHQRLLCCGDAIDDQRGLDGRTALDQT